MESAAARLMETVGTVSIGMPPRAGRAEYPEVPHPHTHSYSVHKQFTHTCIHTYTHIHIHTYISGELIVSRYVADQ